MILLTITFSQVDSSVLNEFIVFTVKQLL